MQTKSKRLVPILAVGITLIIGALLYRHYFLSIPVGVGPAGPGVSRAAFSHPWSNRAILLVGLGDSVTEGYGARPGHGYFDRLFINPSDEFPEMKGLCLKSVLPNLRQLNLAVSGSTSLDLLEHQLPSLPVQSPDISGLVVITTGGNDLIHNYGRTPPLEEAMYGATMSQAAPWVEDFRQRLKTIISGLNSRFPAGCQIYFANIYDPTDEVGDIERTGLPAWSEGAKVLDAYNEVIRACVQKHPSLHLIDFHTTFLGHGIHCVQFWTKHYDAQDPHYWYFTNLEDPNERGYDAIRRLFLNEITKNVAALK